MSDPSRSTINSIKNDMATTKITILEPFNGNPSEDITVWTANSQFLIELHGLDENSAKRVICTALKGPAFDWARKHLRGFQEQQQQSY